MGCKCSLFEYKPLYKVDSGEGNKPTYLFYSTMKSIYQIITCLLLAAVVRTDGTSDSEVQQGCIEKCHTDEKIHGDHVKAENCVASCHSVTGTSVPPTATSITDTTKSSTDSKASKTSVSSSASSDPKSAGTSSGAAHILPSIAFVWVSASVLYSS